VSGTRKAANAFSSSSSPFVVPFSWSFDLSLGRAVVPSCFSPNCSSPIPSCFFFAETQPATLPSSIRLRFNRSGIVDVVPSANQTEDLGLPIRGDPPSQKESKARSMTVCPYKETKAARKSASSVQPAMRLQELLFPDPPLLQLFHITLMQSSIPCKSVLPEIMMIRSEVCCSVFPSLCRGREAELPLDASFASSRHLRSATRDE